MEALITILVSGTVTSSSVYKNDIANYGPSHGISGIVTRNHFLSDLEEFPWLQV